MNRIFGTLVLVLGCAFGLLTAWTSFMAPDRFASSLGFGILNAGGLNEVRAQYAGFFLATAVLCVCSLLGKVRRSTSFVSLIVIFGGLLGGRLVSLFLDGGLSNYGPMIRALYPIDALGLALALVALVLEKHIAVTASTKPVGTLRERAST